MPQTLHAPITDRPVLDRYSFSVPPVFIHLVTLVKRSTGDEVLLNIATLSDRFSDVMNEVNYQRSLLSLVGYEYHESLPLNEPPF